MLADLSRDLPTFLPNGSKLRFRSRKRYSGNFSGSIAAPLPNSRRTVRLSFYLLRRRRVEPTPPGPLPSQLSWFVAKLRAGEIFAVQNPADDLPPEAVGEASISSGQVSIRI